MKPKNLYQRAQELVDTSLTNEPRYHTLNQYQVEQLTAAAMRDAGKYADEYIIESGFFDQMAATLINYFESKDTESRKDLKEKLSDLLIDGALDYAKPSINDALDNASMELSASRYMTKSYADSDDPEIRDQILGLQRSANDYLLYGRK